VVVRQRVTVRAEHLKILKPIIERVTVNVMKLKRYRITQPLAVLTPLAPSGLQMVTNQHQLEPEALHEAPVIQKMAGGLSVRRSLTPTAPITFVVQPELFQIAVERQGLAA
jgi:hypothetical protein